MYSNCLIEAIKAKIKDPKNVQIIRLPKEVNDKKSHYMWIKDDYVFHAYNKDSDKNRLFFDYSIKKVSLDTFQRWLLGKLAATGNLEKYAQKYKLPLYNEFAVKSYEIYTDNPENIFYEENYKYPVDVYEKVKQVMKAEPQIKIIEKGRLSIVSFDELKKKKGTFKYKFITPFDVNFLELYPNNSKLESATILND